MSTPLQEIRCRCIWHIVWIFHVHVHASVASESLAEVVASFLPVVKRRNLKHKMSTKKLVWATQLKSIGLQGMGGEEGILSMALNIHFSCKDPSGWHICSKNSKISVSENSAVIRREVRLLRQPNWIATPLRDLIRSGQVKLIKEYAQARGRNGSIDLFAGVS